MKHECGKKQAIRVEVDQETMLRISSGPLKATDGRGAAPWVRKLINKALEEWESIQVGKTQYRPNSTVENLPLRINGSNQGIEK